MISFRTMDNRTGPSSKYINRKYERIREKLLNSISNDYQEAATNESNR